MFNPFTMAWTSIQLFFAGSWSFIWHWGVGIGAIICLVAAAIFSESIPVLGTYLVNVRRDLLYAAAVIAVFLGGEWLGQHDEANRCVAKTVVIEKVVDKAVTKSKTPEAQAQPDPWDNPNN